MKVIAYHGSKVPLLKKFDWSRQGTGIVTSEKLGGFFFTSCPVNAEYYANFTEDYPNSAFIVRVELTLENPFIADKGAHPSTVVRKISRDLNFDSVVCLDTLDGERYSDIYFAFKPEQIRILGYGTLDLSSTFRKFSKNSCNF